MATTRVKKPKATIKDEAPQEEVSYNGNIAGHIVKHQPSTKMRQDDGSWRIFPPRMVATVVVELADGSQKYVQHQPAHRRFELDEAYDKEESRVAVYNDLQAKVPVGVPCKIIETKGREGRPLYKIELN